MYYKRPENLEITGVPICAAGHITSVHLLCFHRMWISPVVDSVASITIVMVAISVYDKHLLGNIHAVMI